MHPAVNSSRQIPSNIMVVIVALLGFACILMAVMFLPALQALDTVVSSAVLTVQTNTLDKVMVAITMLADSRAVIPVMGLLVASVLVCKQWWLAFYLAVVLQAQWLSVLVVKYLVTRGRPSELLFNGNATFSFPSGHATSATTLFGMTAVLLIAATGQRFRPLIVSVAAVLITLVAFSRVYLEVHWPSDVVAGVLLGVVFTSSVAYQVNLHAAGSQLRHCAPLLTVMLIVYAWYVHQYHGVEMHRYFANQ